ncbi:MAG: OPT/YSL family transporter [Deltaproteobacteria bacterium]|nr:OPT/YSL family transporter [Deltaproteobacteria bacterium]
MSDTPAPPQRLLPRLFPIGSPGYYVLLAAIAIFILGPLGGITASYMNFSLGFFVGGQVLAGILGSTVTYFYGPEGKHGANYMQTMAASVATMAAMGVLLQAMLWLGLPEPPTWKLMAFYTCIGMFGVGVGMLYTPILVDRLQLTYPSGLAVANILRALTDVRLLKRSVAQLFSGIGIGALVPLFIEKGAAAGLGAAKWLGGTGISTSTLGAGMIVGARITIPAITYGLAWSWMTPWLRTQGWLGAEDPYRKFAFIVALGTIMGAAIVDISIILFQAWRRIAAQRAQAADPANVPVAHGEEWKRTNTRGLLVWVAVWGVLLTLSAVFLLDIGLGWVLLAIALVFVFMMVNGISLGISDSNPISSAFVVTVVIMAGLGLGQPLVALLAGSILLVATAVGCDMQQDRSTGWRLGTNRSIQFRYQVIGIFMGAVLAVFMAKLFMEAYPVLKENLFAHPELKEKLDPEGKWQSAMTYKFVGAVVGLTNPKPYQIPAMLIGVGIGFAFEVVRKLVKTNARYQEWKKTGGGSVFDFVFDAFLAPSPYASSFAGFVDLPTSLWFGTGGVVSSAWNTISKRLLPKKAEDAELPEDMSTTSLAGGGLIAGDAIAALVLGIIGLLALVK